MARLNGCHNKPRPTADSSYITQDGWVDVVKDWGGVTRYPKYVVVKASFGTTTCQYDKSTTDAACAGCNHAKTEK